MAARKTSIYFCATDFFIKTKGEYKGMCGLESVRNKILSGSPKESSDTMIRKISWFGIYKMLISEVLSSELPLPYSFVPK